MKTLISHPDSDKEVADKFIADLKAWEEKLKEFSFSPAMKTLLESIITYNKVIDIESVHYQCSNFKLPETITIDDLYTFIDVILKSDDIVQDYDEGCSFDNEYIYSPKHGIYIFMVFGQGTAISLAGFDFMELFSSQLFLELN